MNYKRVIQFLFPQNGHIFVFTGILQATDNIEQLGTVLAHEMAHVVLNHSVSYNSYHSLEPWSLYHICLLELSVSDSLWLSLSFSLKQHIYIFCLSHFLSLRLSSLLYIMYVYLHPSSLTICTWNVLWKILISLLLISVI